jgi:hypothetical protein
MDNGFIALANRITKAQAYHRPAAGLAVVHRDFRRSHRSRAYSIDDVFLLSAQRGEEPAPDLIRGGA